MTWIKSRGLVASYHIFRWFLRQTVRVQYWLRDVIPGLRFAWIGNVGCFVLDHIVLPLKLSLAGILESILITQRRVP
jgi:hypothetical protein